MNEPSRHEAKMPSTWQNRDVVVVGAGVSGVAAAHLLLDCGAHVTLTDSRPAADIADVSELTDRGATLIAGEHPAALWSTVDTAVFSPGIRPDAPVTISAQEAGVTILAEIEVAAGLTEAPVIAITGSNGKSTVTSMVGAILDEAGLQAPVCGNIGTALSEAVRAELNGEIFPDSYVVEVSSFQAHAIREFHPRFAAVLNIQPDHLDWHGSVDAYADAKMRLARNMDDGDWLIYNAGDPELASRLPANDVRLLPFAFEPANPESPAAWVADGRIWWWAGPQKVAIMSVSELGVIGRHNQVNACAAAAIASLLGVAPEPIRAALAKYRALEHRMEHCGDVAGVSCINDSKATNVDATIAALSGFERGVWLILGGRDKGANFGRLRAVLDERIATVLVIGEASDAIAAALDDHIELQRSDTMERAVADALDHAAAGDTLLLSPACTSFDQYPDFEARGRHFKELVGARAAGTEPSEQPMET